MKLRRPRKPVRNSGTRKRGRRSPLRGIARAIRGSIQPIALSLLIGAGLFGLYLGAGRLLASPLFQVRAIQWSGLQHLKEPELARRFQSILGRNLFQVEIGPIQQALLENPWIKGATVRKDFPDQLTFIVEERTPASVAYPSPGGARPEVMRLLDQEGLVLDEGGAYPPELPRVIHVNPAAYPKALRLAALFSDRSDFFIDLSNPEDLQVYLPEGIVHFGEDGYPEKWTRFARVEEDLRQRGFARWEADLRFSNKVIVKGDLPGIKRVKSERSERL